MNAPTFAIVGHPNKGKSSIVSTLTQNDAVPVASNPGTTSEVQRYPLVVDEKTLYTILDTPGFQRARGALEWLSSEELETHERPARLERFVNDPYCQQKFPDEVKLLKPVIEGAAILYVVDGSVPFAPEYEAEMEILRWSASPRMALINPIAGETHVGEWERALSQYFGLVRVFNPVTSSFEKHLDVLRALIELNTKWKAPLQSAISSLQSLRRDKLNRASSLISTALLEMLHMTESEELSEFEDKTQKKRKLEEMLLHRLQAREKALFGEIMKVYEIHQGWSTEVNISFEGDAQLFSEKSWDLFGLTKRELATVGLLTGGALGSSVDVGTGGATMFLGSLIGGGIGAFSALYTAERLVKVKIFSMASGKKRLVAGPVQSAAFFFIALKRALVFHYLVSNRTHARRDEVRMSEDEMRSLCALSESERASFSRLLANICRRREGAHPALTEQLLSVISRIEKEN